eukprot:s1070_g7.t1
MRDWMKSEAELVKIVVTCSGNESSNASSEDSDLEADEAGEDSSYGLANLTGDNLAVRISGSLRFSLEGATTAQAAFFRTELQSPFPVR